MIYVVVLVLNVWLFVAWQKRTVAEPVRRGRGGGRRADRRRSARAPARRREKRVVRLRPPRHDERRESDGTERREPADAGVLDSYVLQEVDPKWLTQAVKPKQFLHIDQAECILCEGCVDICPWKCIHMLSIDAIDEAVNADQPGDDPNDHVVLRRRRRRLHPLRAVRRPLPHRRHHPRQGHRPVAPTATPTTAPTDTATPTASGSDGESALGAIVANGNGSGNGHRPKIAERAREPSATRRARSQAWNSIFRPGLGLPQGLHRQPP